MQISPHPLNLTAGKTYSAAEVTGAAKNFESILLQSMLDSLEKTFAVLPGQKNDQASDNYRYLGTQALAAKLADAGGIGIARMITKNLLKNKEKTPTSAVRLSKV